ncbi:hypothetical protein HK098_004484 [Nowakowskiella sp. JEL0407]|nr:hypothetical protein HK098_004484 [Nowakowskiella sp. JEL0407]
MPGRRIFHSALTFQLSIRILCMGYLQLLRGLEKMGTLRMGQMVGIHMKRYQLNKQCMVSLRQLRMHRISKMKLVQFLNPEIYSHFLLSTKLGTISPKKLADFAVFDRDFIKEAQSKRFSEILKAQCVATAIGGKPELVLEKIFDFVDKPQTLMETCKLFNSMGNSPIRRFNFLIRSSKKDGDYMMEYSYFFDKSKNPIMVYSRFRNLLNDERVLLFASAKTLPFDIMITLWASAVKVTEPDGKHGSANLTFVEQFDKNFSRFGERFANVLTSAYLVGLFSALRGNSPELAIKYLSSVEGCKIICEGALMQKNRSPLLMAISNNWITVVEKMYQTAPQLFTKPDMNGVFPIHHAAARCDVTIMEFLLSLETIDPLLLSSVDYTCLHYACAANNVPVVKFLLENISPEAGLRSGARLSALQASIRADSSDSIRILLGCDSQLQLTWRCDDRMTPAHYAAKIKSDALRMLFKCPIEWDAIDRCESTPLHYAVINHDLSDVSELVSRYPPAMNALNHSKQSPLHFAIRHGRFEIVKYLLESRCNRYFEVSSGHYKSSFHVAASHGRADVCGLLLAYGANPTEKLRYVGDSLDPSKHSEFVELIRILLAYGVNPYTLEIKDRHALSYAITYGIADVIPYLLYGIGKEEALEIRERMAEYCKSVDDANPYFPNYVQYTAPPNHGNKSDTSYTPLKMAVYHNQSTEILEKLLEFGVDVNITAGGGKTALHYAISMGKLEHARQLLRYSPHDLTIRDNSGLTAVDVAVNLGLYETVFV